MQWLFDSIRQEVATTEAEVFTAVPRNIEEIVKREQSIGRILGLTRFEFLLTSCINKLTEDQQNASKPSTDSPSSTKQPGTNAVSESNPFAE